MRLLELKKKPEDMSDEELLQAMADCLDDMHETWGEIEIEQGKIKEVESFTCH